MCKNAGGLPADAVFALLSDNAVRYQGNLNNAYSVRTRIWQDVDNDRCGVPPHLMDPDFGFESYAETVLTRPLIVSLRGNRTKAVGRKSAQEIYGSYLLKKRWSTSCPCSFRRAPQILY